jgi:cell division protein FtsB
MTRRLWLTLSVTVAGTAIGIYSGFMPWEAYSKQRADADRATADMRQAESRRADLVRQENRVRSSNGKAELARQKGYLMDGEIPLSNR